MLGRRTRRRLASPPANLAVRSGVTVSRPVSGILYSPKRAVAIHLCGPPGDVDRAGHPLLGLAPGGGYRAARVTPDAGALLPHRFTLTCAARKRTAIGGLLSVALYRQVAPSWLSPALCPLESRLSSTPSRPKTTGAAATQPAHRPRHGTNAW